jgi:uncharacterized membrane protein YbhN (UPF0104 family)
MVRTWTRQQRGGKRVANRFGTNARIGLGLIVSAVCLWLAVRQTPLGDLADALQRVNYWWILAVVVGNVVALWVRGMRWRVLLANRGTTTEYFWAQAIGNLLTNIFPLRAGEAGRVVVVSRRVRLPLVHVGASVVLERAADMIVLLGLLAVILVVMDVPTALTAGGLVLGAVLLVALVGVGVLIVFGRRLTPLMGTVAARLPERLGVLLVDTWGHGLAALEPLRDPWVVFQVGFWSVVIWLFGIGMFWASIESVAPTGRLIEASFAMAATALGVALPSSPGFIGVFQLIGQQALVTPFPDRFTPASALTVALLYHLSYYITTTALGAVGMLRLGMSLRTVRAEAAEVQVEAAPATTIQGS